MSEDTLYERLGGVFANAAVVEHFSDAIIRNPKVSDPAVVYAGTFAAVCTTNRQELRTEGSP